MSRKKTGFDVGFYFDACSKCGRQFATGKELLKHRCESVHKFKVGDVVSAQGATLKVLKLITTPDGRPAYEMVSPFTKGEPWLVGEWALEFCKKVRAKRSKS